MESLAKTSGKKMGEVLGERDKYGFGFQKFDRRHVMRRPLAMACDYLRGDSSFKQHGMGKGKKNRRID